MAGAKSFAANSDLDHFQYITTLSGAKCNLFQADRAPIILCAFQKPAIKTKENLHG